MLLRQYCVRNFLARAELKNQMNFHTSPSYSHRYRQNSDYIKNFEDFTWPNKITTFEHHKLPKSLIEHEFSHPICRDTMGIRWPGYWFKRKFVYVKEMEPEIIVPDLEGFKLKPYVSYKTRDSDTEPITAKSLFEAVYEPMIKENFEKDQLQEFSVPQEEIDNARLKAMQTGADIFEENPLDGVRAPTEYTVDLRDA